MSDEPRWEESDSELFIRYGDVFTPSRREQLTMLVDLLPAEVGDTFVVLDLGCGAGPLTGAILDAYPRSIVIALDNSPSMLKEVEACHGQVGNRLRTVRGDLRNRDWFEDLAEPLRAVVSSLAIHHLDGEQKALLYRDLASRLEPGGAVLFVDLVEPVNGRAENAYARAWHRAVSDQSKESGLPQALDVFRDGFNHYRTPDLDFDKPSRLTDNLQWLRDAGLIDVDCFWLQAGHALYGGYKGTE